MDYQRGMTWKELRVFLYDQYEGPLKDADIDMSLRPKETREVIQTMHEAVRDSVAPGAAKLYHTLALYAFRGCLALEIGGILAMEGIDRGT